MKNIRKEIDSIKSDLEQSPDNSGLLNELGVGYHLLGEYNQAVRTYKKALSHNPDNVHAVHYNLANSYFELQQIELAVNHYMDALELKPDYVPAINNLADIYELADEKDKAREMFEYITKISPDDPIGHFNLGNHYLRSNQSVEAGRCYKKAVELDPGFHEAYYNIGLILKHLDQFEEAITYYEKCLKIEPSYQPAQQDLKECREALQENSAGGMGTN